METGEAGETAETGEVGETGDTGKHAAAERASKGAAAQAASSGWRGRRRIPVTSIAASTAFLAVAAVSAQPLPTDPDALCAIPPATINGWFKAGSASLDGVVNPANSVSFINLPNCPFYEWSEHMFLWLTSPAPALYGGGGGRIFESTAFFDVAPPDGSGQRPLLPHGRGHPTRLGPFSRQLGPHKLPLFFDRQGTLLEVAPAPRGLAPEVRDASGRLVRIGHARLGDGGQLLIEDRAGRRIEPALLLPPPRAQPAVRALEAAAPLRVRKVVVDGAAFFLDPAGHLVDANPGEADGSVLIAQNGSPVYYGIAVNEVMAIFRTQQGPTVPPGLIFPTTQGELDTITTFASAHGRTFIDPAVLVFEIKTAWVEAAGLPNPGDYITMSAEVPSYDKSNPAHWVKTGTHTATVALVGMHVVGSANGHPEMIWATFEHLGNAPNDAYSYRNSVGGTTSLPAGTSGTWLLASSGASGPFNAQRQLLSGDDILASSTALPIGPDNIMRRKPWGAASDLAPNPLASPAASNGEIIAVNNSVRAALTAGDVRRNYIMTGSTWMIAGSFPFTTFKIKAVGTNRLNNTTMESFTQGADTHAAATFSCFGCHSGGKTTDVSHVFSDLKPLF